MDITKVNLDAPAFGEGSQKIEELDKKDDAIEPAETVVTDKTGDTNNEPLDEGNRVRYSRFRNVLTRAEEAEKQAEYWRGVAEATKQKVEPTNDLPDFWQKLYGDSPESQEAWKVQKQMNERLKEEARQEALNAIRGERQQEEERIKGNLEQIDSHIESLADKIGRDLTEQEESSVLDIIDEYTPKDDNGNYLGAILSAEKAWEIHELKTQASKAPKQKSRDNVASLSGSQSQGEPSTDKDKNFNPSWGSLGEAIKRRL